MRYTSEVAVLWLLGTEEIVGFVSGGLIFVVWDCNDKSLLGRRSLDSARRAQYHLIIYIFTHGDEVK